MFSVRTTYTAVNGGAEKGSEDLRVGSQTALVGGDAVEDRGVFAAKPARISRKL
jgi:hypothetical protein